MLHCATNLLLLQPILCKYSAQPPAHININNKQYGLIPSKYHLTFLFWQRNAFLDKPDDAYSHASYISRPLHALTLASVASASFSNHGR